ncbi:MAG: hypothetical protein HY904_15710 [Deltaproteobacteria bacterium]|nr:hypothetical protein [Deltaproteobacteria bacterium]
MRRFFVVSTLLMLAGAGLLQARTAMTPTPRRDKANLQLGERGHLVNETRTVGLTKGTNTVLFSWKNVVIDPGSLMLTVLGGGDDVRVIGFTFPPGDSGAVEAEVFAEKDAVTTFRVSYLLGNITRETSYQGVLDGQGGAWRIHKEATAFNRSGERFDDVDVALGSGLSYRGPLGMPEGRKVNAMTPSPIPSQRIYRVPLSPMPYVGGAPQPLTPELFYVLVNDTALTPDKSALLPGKIRLFQLDRQGSQAFLGEDLLPTVAHGEKAEVRGGGAPDLRVKWFLDKDEDRNVVRVRASAQEPDTYVIRADRFRRYRIEVKNFKTEPASVRAVIPVGYQSGVRVEKSTHPTEIEKNHTDGITVRVDAPGGGKETVATVDVLYPDYVFNTR